MGSTLEHGIYLPSEGEKNCYQGLAGNWNKVDGALGDIAELKQSIESKFTKEIVTELPTEDINPFCIYMILKTDPETDNIYDEWVYINNAWEYLGNTQVDMTQYYTKQEVNELPAVASGVTSTKVGNYDTHLADSNIHVTANDKSKWNTVALIKQLRLVNTQVGSATTIAFANIDDTNGIKVGDKCMDLDAKMFEITAVDTTNETVTVGSALIDLALDGNVVHTSGNETISGNKTFSETSYIYNSDSTGNEPNIIFRNSKYAKGDTTNTGEQRLIFTDSSNTYVGYISSNKNISGTQFLSFTIYTTDNNNANISSTINYYLSKNGERYFTPYEDGLINLGGANRKWKNVCATNYYYGSNNVEFSTKFVTTDTAQTVSGAKTFSDNLTIYNSDDTVAPKGLTIRNAQWGMGESGGTTVSNINFLDKNSSIPASVMASKGLYGQSFLRFSVRTKDSQNNTYSEEIYYDIDTSGNVEFRSWHDNTISLGTSVSKWKDVQTKLINGLTPSSLGMPDLNNGIDISGYLTNLNKSLNTYTPPVNGWIEIELGKSSLPKISMRCRQTDGLIYSTETSEFSSWGISFPVVGGKGISIYLYADSLNKAKFFPCLGNV